MAHNPESTSRKRATNARYYTQQSLFQLSQSRNPALRIFPVNLVDDWPGQFHSSKLTDHVPVLTRGLRKKPKYLPDWRRNHSKGFLPAWLVLFTVLLGTEWGLRRYWGMV